MAKPKKQSRAKEFAENRTSWKFFNRLIEKRRDAALLVFETEPTELLNSRLLLEVLKEIQYSNDNGKR